MWQQIDPVAFISDFADRIYHVDCKDTKMRMGGGRNGILSSHLPWGRPAAGLGLRLDGPRGCALGVKLPRADRDRLRRAHSVEWEDAGMDRLQGAPEALAFLKSFDFAPPTASFDAAFKQ
jgi:sugar phosphate isomerase/epimerase